MRSFFEKTKNISKKEFLDELKDKIDNQQKCFVITANPEIFMLGRKIEYIREILCSDKTTMIVDGIGLLLAGKRIGIEYKERIPGVEICEELLQYANKKKKKVYLFGASQEVMELLVHKIQREFSGIVLSGFQNGYVEEKDLVFEQMKKLEPDIVLVALGMPLQESLIYKHLDDFQKGVFVGLGGSFDVVSGYKKRAPKIFVKLNLEWLYRITREPKRLKRFWNNNIKFLFEMRKYK